MHLGSVKCYFRWLLGLHSQQKILSRLWLGGVSWKILTKFAGAMQRRKALRNSKFCQSHQSGESLGSPWTFTLTGLISWLFGVSGWRGGEESCQRHQAQGGAVHQNGRRPLWVPAQKIQARNNLGVKVSSTPALWNQGMSLLCLKIWIYRSY